MGICLGMQVMTIEYARNVLGQQGANSVEMDASTSFPTIIYMPETDSKGVVAANSEVATTLPVKTKDLGGTMRLGSRATYVNKYLANGEPSLAWELYGCEHRPHHSRGDDGQVTAVVYERYRHRYEVNPAVINTLEASGLCFSGRGFAEGDDTVILNADIMNADDQQQQQHATTATTNSDRQEIHKLCRMEIVELPRSVHPYYTGGQFHPEYKSRPDRPAPMVFGFIKACLDRQQQFTGRTAAVAQEVSEPTSKRLCLPLNLSATREEDPQPASGRRSSRMIATESVSVCPPIESFKEHDLGIEATAASAVLTSSRILPTVDA
jgi:CTP synthase